MELLFLIVIGAVFLYFVSRPSGKTKVYDPRSTEGHEPQKWLSEDSPISCPHCKKTKEARAYFRKSGSNDEFICPDCRTEFEFL